MFDKGYTQRWTEEVFKISKIQLTIPVTYKITDYNEEETQGSFYEQELQKTSQSAFRIEKVLKRQADKSLEKWMGYPKSFNSWIVTNTIVKLTIENRFKTVEKKKQSLKHVLIITTKYHLPFISSQSSRNPQLHYKH